jgi:hypothetical protein
MQHLSASWKEKGDENIAGRKTKNQRMVMKQDSRISNIGYTICTAVFMMC